MPGRAEREEVKKPSTSEGALLGPRNCEETKKQPHEVVTLGAGSRSPVVETAHQPSMPGAIRGLLPVPPEVEAEVNRQQARQPLTPEYRKKLCDRLTLGHYFSDIEVAFRRTPEGIEVLAAGLDEITQFRRTTTCEERRGVVYGVG